MAPISSMFRMESSFDSISLEDAPAEPTGLRKDKDALTVKWVRLSVILVLLVSAGIVGVLSYALVHSNEQEAYHSKFAVNARQVLTASSEKAVSVAEWSRYMSRVYTSFAAEKGAVIPFQTMVASEALAESLREVVDANLVASTPYLPNEAFRLGWEEYAVDNQEWIYVGQSIRNPTLSPSDIPPIPNRIWRHSNETNNVVLTDTLGPPYVPLWWMSPPPNDTSRIQLNLYRYAEFAEMVEHVRNTERVVMSAPVRVREWLDIPLNDTGPESVIMKPLFSSLQPTRAYFSGVLWIVIPFSSLFAKILRSDITGIMVVVDSCGKKNSFVIDGQESRFEGEGDLHDPSYDGIKEQAYLDYIPGDDPIVEMCRHLISVYPTKQFQNENTSNNPLLYSGVVIGLFGFAILVFVLYDIFVTLRQRKTEKEAERTDQIMGQLFPDKFREKLFREEDGLGNGKAHKGGVVTSGMQNSEGAADPNEKPIAELFPQATVLFADIAGFTAWSSIRNPSHVFKLLESIFQAFDEVAKKYGVFKVETVGDCYVAVVGLPTPCKHHAMVMARFARECCEKFLQVVRSLEMSLGPDTSDLAVRIGMHSGPVTAGVLRGDRARFQLFGETVNLAARIESTGRKERIHISEQTAHMIIAAGKSEWVVAREELIDSKGRGDIRTYWLKTKAEGNKSSNSVGSSHPDDNVQLKVVDDHGKTATLANHNIAVQMAERTELDRRTQRLVDWNCELLAQLLRQIVVRRHSRRVKPTAAVTLDEIARSIGNGINVVDEVAEVIVMPEFDPNLVTIEASTLELSEEAYQQLRQFVSMIASMYRDNPFHNFEHASHVTMSVTKLLSRIVAPKSNIAPSPNDDRNLDELLHDHTYGITSDPLTQFAVIVSALIHDVDHRGVPNFVLANEDKTLAACYKGQSIAEQNSLDLAWNALLADGFEDLRMAIYGDISELQRFRQLLVNSVIATDVFDKKLGEQRVQRWIKAFAPEGSTTRASPSDNTRKNRDRKATIVIEHLIQASDVAHTMQHWHVYQKWNERLFEEMYTAFRSGRLDKDPSENWYKGELGFFDGYIIPLAKKLKECGVFGVSSDEYLNYALENRKEWAVRGEEIVSKFVERCNSKQTFDNQS